MSIMGSSCIFPVPDIKKTEKYYVDYLGFSAKEYLNHNEPHICLYRDKVEIILLQANSRNSSNGKVFPNRVLYGYGYDAYIYTDEQEKLESEFLSKNVNIVRPLSLTDYKNRELVIEDIDGRWLAFGLKET